MRILIAEDENISRTALAAILKAGGHEVVITCNGREAWQELQKPDAPHLAILDWMMPEMDGLDVVRRVRALKTNHPHYLIILTSRDKNTDIVDALKAGADDYLAKPYDSKVLRARVDAGQRIITMQEQLTSQIQELSRTESERERLQLQLNHAQKMESIGRLAGGVAHDFNNKLAVIIGYVDLAHMRTQTDLPLLGYLSEIRKAAESSAELTRQLLAFARKETVAPQVLDLNETVAGMLKMLRRLMDEEIELIWIPGADLWRISIDPGQVDQVLANLCVNARDAIHGAGRIIIRTDTVTFDASHCAANDALTPGDYVSLAVSDDGCGMDTETQANIFEPFFTTKEVGMGTGLGLASVYGAVTQNNGFIDVQSEPGRGTTFTVYLPRYLGGSASVRKEPQPEPPACGNETILLVEDVHELLDIVRLQLESIGYRVLPAATVADAMRHAEQHGGEIDLLMTDVVLPKMNGRELADALPLGPNVRRLFMSGYTSDIIARQGVLDEGVNFIQKPFSIQSLAHKIRKVLDA